MNRKNISSKNIRVTYCLVILFGFALLFPGAAFQNAFAHPISYDRDNWGTKDFDSSKCTEVTVSADITNLEIIWTSDEDDFDDGVGGYSGAEIEILYKIWEPKHTKEGYGKEEYDSAHKIPNMRHPGKIVSAIQIEDIEFNGEGFVKLTDDSGKEGTWPTAEIAIQTEWGYKDGFWDRHHNHQKYFHPTCVEDLDKLVLAVAVSEIDGGGWLEHQDIDKLFGGTEMEDAIEKNTQKESLSQLSTLIVEGRDAAEKKFGDVSYSLPGENIEFQTNTAGRVLVEVTEKVILEKGVEDNLLPYLADYVHSKISTDAMQAAIKNGATAKAVAKAGTEAVEKSSLVKMMNTIANEHLAEEIIEDVIGKGGKTIPGTIDAVIIKSSKELAGEVVEKSAKKIVKSGVKKVAGYLLGGPVGWVWFAYDTVGDISDVWDYFNGPNQFLGSGVWRIDLSTDQVGQEPFLIKTATKMVPVVEYTVPPPDREGETFYSTNPFPSKEVKKILKTQFGTTEVTFEIEIKRPFCVSLPSSRTPEGAEQSLGQSFNLNDVDTSLDNSDSLNNYVNKQFEMLTNIIQKHNVDEPIEEYLPESTEGSVEDQMDSADSAEYELILHPETGLLINPVTGMIEFFPEEKLVEKPKTESGPIPLPEVDPPFRFLKSVDGNSELREDENGNKEAVFNFLILDDKGEPPKSPEITIFQNQEAVALSENDFSTDENGWFQYVQDSPGEWAVSIADIKSQEENQVFDGSLCFEFTEIVPPRDCMFKSDDIATFDTSYSKMNPPIGNSYTVGQTFQISPETIQGLGHPEYLEIPPDGFYETEPTLIPYVFVEQKSWFDMRHQHESFVSQYKPDENHAHNDMWASWRFVYSNGEPASGLYMIAGGVNNEYPDSAFGGSGSTDENGFFEISGGGLIPGNYTFSLGDLKNSDNYSQPFIVILNENEPDESCFSSKMNGSTLDQKIVLLEKSGGIAEKYANFVYKLTYEDGEPLKNTLLTHQIECEKWIGMGNNLMYTERKTFTDEFGVASGGQFRGDSEGCYISMWIEELSMDGMPYNVFEQNQEVWEQSKIILN